MEVSEERARGRPRHRWKDVGMKDMDERMIVQWRTAMRSPTSNLGQGDEEDKVLEKCWGGLSILCSPDSATNFAVTVRLV